MFGRSVAVIRATGTHPWIDGPAGTHLATAHLEAHSVEEVTVKIVAKRYSHGSPCGDFPSDPKARRGEDPKQIRISSRAH